MLPMGGRHGLTPVKLNRSLRDPTPERAVTPAVINKPNYLPRITLPAERARVTTIGVLSATTSVLRADVVEVMRVTRCMRFLVRGGPMLLAHKAPFRSQLGSVLVSHMATATPTSISTP